MLIDLFKILSLKNQAELIHHYKKLPQLKVYLNIIMKTVSMALKWAELSIENKNSKNKQKFTTEFN